MEFTQFMCKLGHLVVYFLSFEQAKLSTKPNKYTRQEEMTVRLVNSFWANKFFLFATNIFTFTVF